MEVQEHCLSKCVFGCICRPLEATLSMFSPSKCLHFIPEAYLEKLSLINTLSLFIISSVETDCHSHLKYFSSFHKCAGVPITLHPYIPNCYTRFMVDTHIMGRLPTFLLPTFNILHPTQNMELFWNTKGMYNSICYIKTYVFFVNKV